MGEDKPQEKPQQVEQPQQQGQAKKPSEPPDTQTRFTTAVKTRFPNNKTLTKETERLEIKQK